MKSMNELPEAWRLAVRREVEAHSYYARMAQAASDEGTRALFQMLAEQEQEHADLLEAEYRRLFEPDLELGRPALPIKWYEWDDESFRLAEVLELPLMLYLTTPWCEPCHLMERTTLADPKVVDAINAGLIPIRVDADKRPDVDARYNRGGWPTIAFLDAAGEVLESHNFMTADQMLAAVGRVRASIEEVESASAPAAGARPGGRAVEAEPGPQAVGSLTPELPGRILRAVSAAYDPQHGGFGPPPKFPQPDVLEFVLATAHRTGDPALGEMVRHSLEAMANGGLHDPVAGGFFRYAMSADWSRPHYEKMAGDQAQLLTLYLHAYQATGWANALSIARSTLAYLDTTLWDRDQGYFMSSQAADPAYYARDARGRAGAPAPYVDRTLYTERNAAVASAYLLASSVLNEPRYADLAVRALEFAWQQGYRAGLGMHHYFDGQPHLPGMLADQVAMAQAWLDAYEHFGREADLERGETLLRFMGNALRDEDGRFFDTLAVPEAVGRLRRRDKPFCENVAAAEIALRLYRLTGREELEQLARETLEALVPVYRDLGFEAARFGLAVDRFLRRPLIITVVGENEDAARAELLRAARRAYAPNKTVQAVDPVWEPARLDRLGYPAEPAPAAYVCLGTRCAPPTADPDEVLAQAEAMAGLDRSGQASGEDQGYRIEGKEDKTLLEEKNE